MQKLQSNWALAQPLEAALRASKLGHRELAEAANVKYYAVRRMRLDGVKNRSKNAIALCKFFRLSEPLTLQISEKDLVSAVVESWDRTAEHGYMLLELIKCVGQYRVSPKQ